MKERETMNILKIAAFMLVAPLLASCDSDDADAQMENGYEYYPVGTAWEEITCNLMDNTTYFVVQYSVEGDTTINALKYKRVMSRVASYYTDTYTGSLGGQWPSKDELERRTSWQYAFALREENGRVIKHEKDSDAVVYDFVNHKLGGYPVWEYIEHVGDVSHGLFDVVGENANAEIVATNGIVHRVMTFRRSAAEQPLWDDSQAYRQFFLPVVPLVEEGKVWTYENVAYPGAKATTYQYYIRGDSIGMKKLYVKYEGVPERTAALLAEDGRQVVAKRIDPTHQTYYVMENLYDFSLLEGQVFGDEAQFTVKSRNTSQHGGREQHDIRLTTVSGEELTWIAGVGSTCDLLYSTAVGSGSRLVRCEVGNRVLYEAE